MVYYGRMNALVLGGASPRHKQWVEVVSETLRPAFDEVRTLQYNHWAEGNADIDLEAEISQAAVLAQDFAPYVVVAKSIGTVVTALAVSRGLLHPKRCVFLGFPLTAVTSALSEVDTAIAQLPPTIFVHNEFDKVGSSLAVQEYLNGTKCTDYKLLVNYGNSTHDYLDYSFIVELATAA